MIEVEVAQKKLLDLNIIKIEIFITASGEKRIGLDRVQRVLWHLEPGEIERSIESRKDVLVAGEIFSTISLREFTRLVTVSALSRQNNECIGILAALAEIGVERLLLSDGYTNTN
jgi:hypothetical protein